MKKNEEYYPELIVRYFAGEASSSEMKELSEWIKESSDNRDIFSSYCKTWNLLAAGKVDEVINTKTEFLKLQARLTTSGSEHSKETETLKISPPKKIFTARYLKIAASVVLIFSLSFMFIYLFKGNRLEQITAANNVVNYVFPDNSQLALNSGTVKFDKEFGKRKVELEGEAFFDIFHDSLNPFIIDAGDVIIEDLGTSLYVNTNESGKIVTVMLKEGKAAVYSKESPGIKHYLQPGEKVEYNPADKTIRTVKNDDVNLLAWKTKEIIFNDITLNKIIPVLNKVYRVNITFRNESTGNCRFTGEFENQPLESVLNVIKEALNVDISVKHSEIEISGHGCD